MPRLLPPSVALWISVVTDREVQKVLTDLTAKGYAEASVRRFRASLSSFFEWAVRERSILTNPGLRTRVLRVGRPKVEMYPFTEEDLERIHATASQRDQRLADLLLVAGVLSDDAPPDPALGQVIVPSQNERPRDRVLSAPVLLTTVNAIDTVRTRLGWPPDVKIDRRHD